MTVPETALIGATPLQEHGYQGEVNWTSETNDARTTLTVLAQTGLLNQFDHFTTEYVGSRFDVLTGAFVRGKSDINDLDDLIESIVFCLFIPTQTVTQTDWQSVYTFGKEALVRTDWRSHLVRNSEPSSLIAFSSPMLVHELPSVRCCST